MILWLSSPMQLKAVEWIFLENGNWHCYRTNGPPLRNSVLLLMKPFVYFAFLFFGVSCVFFSFHVFLIYSLYSASILCLIAKPYQRYALKTANQGVYHNKVWGCAEFARLLHKIRFFFLGQMNVLLWTPSKTTYIYMCTYLLNWVMFQLHFGGWALKEF